MSDNKNLHKANKEKNDEFYTQLSDIENVLNFLIKRNQQHLGMLLLENCIKAYIVCKDYYKGKISVYML